MQTINLFLTFDYELPLGGWSVSPENALIEPANAVLKLCDKLQVPAVFFVDVLSFIWFKNQGESVFEESIRNQLKEVMEKGHDLQLHLHPHWFTSSFENGVYKPSKDFRLADFKESEIDDMVIQGIDYLNGIAKSINPDYKCLAFRAGGYNLENSALIFRILEKNGILIDSSICHGYYYASDVSTIDYRYLPDKANWYFSGGYYEQAALSGVYEIPIAGKEKSLFEVPTFIKTRMYKNRAPENRGKMIHSETKLPMKKRYWKMMSSRMLSFDNYAYSPQYLLEIVNYNLKKYSEQEEINLAAIGHPKTMDRYNLWLMENFIEMVRETYGKQIQFCTFQNFAKK